MKNPICHIALFLPSLAGGGAERVMVNLANEWAQQGLLVDMVLATAEGPFLKQLLPQVRIIDLGTRRTLAALPRLARYLRDASPNALLSAMDHANVVAIGAKLLSRAQTRLTISVHCSQLDYKTSVHGLRHRFLPILGALAYRFADARVAVSTGVAKEYGSTVGGKKNCYAVVHNPILTTELMRTASERSFSEATKRQEEPTLIAVGRLAPQKDYPTLLRAYAIARRTRQLRLIILGEGPERSNIEMLCRELGIASEVTLLGYVSDPFIHMKKASLCILSSAWEGFGNVLVEAMACGTPVVSTDCPSGPREILADGEFGPLVSVGDYYGLAEAILRTLANPPDASALQRRASNFTAARAAQRYLELMLGPHSSVPSE